LAVTVYTVFSGIDRYFFFFCNRKRSRRDPCSPITHSGPRFRVAPVQRSEFTLYAFTAISYAYRLHVLLTAERTSPIRTSESCLKRLGVKTATAYGTKSLRLNLFVKAPRKQQRGCTICRRRGGGVYCIYYRNYPRNRDIIQMKTWRHEVPIIFEN